MKITKMDGASLVTFLCGGCTFLGVNKDDVNALNVFPVPDGDTGINMFLTINSAVKNLQGQTDIKEIAKSFSMGALMGARGNSGVILSQILRGLGKSLDSKTALNPADFADALQAGVDLAYKSVMKPVEGTILTVSKDCAAAAQKSAAKGDDIIAMLQYVLQQGEISLANTPNLLPVLKEAGVVDAGGKGFLVVLEGGLKALMGEDLGKTEFAANNSSQNEAVFADERSQVNIEFGYCSEMLVQGKNIDAEAIRKRLSHTPKGDSLVVVGTEDVVKIHMHSNAPWEVLAYVSQFGTLHDIKIDNMREQHQNLVAQGADPMENKSLPSETIAINTPSNAADNTITATGGQKTVDKCGVIAVAAGDGLADIFTDIGVQSVILGGQTMNPCAEDLLNAINEITAEDIIILPNNSNIILTAQQAKELSEKNVFVLPTKYSTQGLSCMLNFNKDVSGAENIATMTEALAVVKNGEITYAVRDSNYSGLNIHENDILALYDGEIKAYGHDLTEMLLKLLSQMIDGENDTIISLFYGNDLPEEQVETIVATVTETYPEMDIEYHYGGQPLYYFLLSVE